MSPDPAASDLLGSIVFFVVVFGMASVGWWVQHEQKKRRDRDADDRLFKEE